MGGEGDATRNGDGGRLVSRAELARIVRRPAKRIDVWLDRGLADAAAVERAGPGKRWKLDLGYAIEWLIEDRERQLRDQLGAAAAPGGTESADALDLNEQRAREAKERADKYALENAQARRELIRVDEVVEFWGRMIVAAKRQIRGIPIQAKSTGILPDMTLEQSEALLALIDAGLRELGSNGIPDADDDGGRESLDDGGEPLDASA